MRRARFPTFWLFTDERLGSAAPDAPLWRALRALPRNAGVVFRHYSLAPDARAALLAQIVGVARRRGLAVVGSRIAGAPDGVHRPVHAPSRRTPSSRVPSRRASSRSLVTASAHSHVEALASFRAGADLVFLSPVFPTRSHPGAPALGPIRFGLAVRGLPGPVIALGGLDALRLRRLRPLGAAGYAGIDCWLASAGVSRGFPGPAADRSAAIRQDPPA
jgi:thiamine-phosphate pyrophosphorylase